MPTRVTAANRLLARSWPPTANLLQTFEAWTADTRTCPQKQRGTATPVIAGKEFLPPSSTATGQKVPRLLKIQYPQPTQPTAQQPVRGTEKPGQGVKNSNVAESLSMR